MVWRVEIAETGERQGWQVEQAPLAALLLPDGGSAGTPLPCGGKLR